MKKFAVALTFISVFFQAAPVMAWVGGPYGNNTHDGFQGGVFQAMMTMKNGSGMLRFSTGLEPLVSPFAQSVVFHKGLGYFGECFGMVDFPSKKVSGATNGLTQLLPVTATPTTGTGVPQVFSNGNVQKVCNTTWNGKITSSAPAVRFRAKGWAYFFDASYINTTDTVIITSGIFEELQPIPNGGFRDTSIVQVITEHEDPPMEKVKIRVLGGRVTPVAYTTFGTAAPTP